MSEDFAQLERPLEIKGGSEFDKISFYHLARNNVIYQTRDENRNWNKQLGRNVETAASNNIMTSIKGTEEGSIRKWVKSITVVVNRGLLLEKGRAAGEDYLSLIPYLVEHEVYEAWLTAKKGAGSDLSQEKKHLLARRREFYLAVKEGLGERLYRFQMSINPSKKAEYDDALDYAKRRLKK